MRHGGRFQHKMWKTLWIVWIKDTDSMDLRPFHRDLDDFGPYFTSFSA